MSTQPDMTWFIPIACLCIVGAGVLLGQLIIVVHCAEKREKGLRASNWLEWIAGYDKEQRKKHLL